jgi:hypothetical protein
VLPHLCGVNELPVQAVAAIKLEAGMLCCYMGQPEPHLAEASTDEVAVPVADPAVLGAHGLPLLAVLALWQLKVEEDAAGSAGK